MRPLITCLLILVLALPVIGQTTSVVKDAVANNESMYYFHQRKVARSSNNVLMVAWVDLPNSTAGAQVQYSTYDAGFGIWSPPTAVSNAADRARQASLAADDNGNIHATWMERANSADEYQQYYAKFNGTTWSTPAQVSLGGTSRAEEGVVEAGKDGTIWVIYNTDGEGAGNEWVLAVRSTDGGTTWSTTADTLSVGGTIGASITNARVAVTAGSGGKIVAAWHDGQPWNTDRREIYAASFDGSSWTVAEMISDTTTSDRSANWYPGVAMDDNDNIYVVYHTNDASGSTERQLLVQKKAWADPWSASTTTQVAVETGGDMLSVSAVGDADGNIHVVYRRDMVADTVYGLDEIAYTYSGDGGTTWLTPIAISRAEHDGGYVSLANRVRAGAGIDAAWRESPTINVNDEATTDIVHANIPSGLTGVPDELPQSYVLFANYPNPFNPSTSITFTLRAQQVVRLSVYDANGRLVRTLKHGSMEAGSHNLLWDGMNANGVPMASGIYLSRLVTSDGAYTIKMLLLK